MLFSLSLKKKKKKKTPRLRGFWACPAGSLHDLLLSRKAGIRGIRHGFSQCDNWSRTCGTADAEVWLWNDTGSGRRSRQRPSASYGLIRSTDTTSATSWLCGQMRRDEGLGGSYLKWSPTVLIEKGSSVIWRVLRASQMCVYMRSWGFAWWRRWTVKMPEMFAA